MRITMTMLVAAACGAPAKPAAEPPGETWEAFARRTTSLSDEEIRLQRPVVYVDDEPACGMERGSESCYLGEALCRESGTDCTPFPAVACFSFTLGTMGTKALWCRKSIDACEALRQEGTKSSDATEVAPRCSLLRWRAAFPGHP